MENSKLKTPAFSAANPNFWAGLLITILGVLGIMGIKFPLSPEQTGEQIVTTITGGGFYAVIGILITSVIMPIVNYVRSKPTPSVVALLGSANTWIYIGSFILSVVVLFGIQIPAGTADGIVGSIWAKDWAGLITIVITNLINPLVRWFRDKRNQPPVTLN